jgi:sialic acid synthase SpsE
VFVIAGMSAHHDQSFDEAARIIRTALQKGHDVIYMNPLGNSLEARRMTPRDIRIKNFLGPVKKTDENK